VYRFLLSRRWLGLLAAALAAATACVLLGMWQLDRLQGRHARNDLLRGNLSIAPAPVNRLLGVDRPPAEADQWRRVQARGRYDTQRELLVRNRTLEGAVGYHVLTPLVTDDGPALLVDRGWVPAGESASDVPDVPPAPEGEVVLTARIRPGASTSRRSPQPSPIRCTAATASW
jgi:cytochrome oxidase assembly protein ShyY1